MYAPLEDKVARAIEQKKIKPEDAKRTVQQIDKRRSNHYNTFTESVWGDRKNYDLLINSSLLGLEATSKLIAEVAKK